MAQSPKYTGTTGTAGTAADSPVTHNRQIRFQNALDILGKQIYLYANRMYEMYWGQGPLVCNRPAIIVIPESVEKKPDG